MYLSLFPSQPIAAPLEGPPSAALAYLERALREQPRALASWPSERARLTGSVEPSRIVLRLGTRHRWVVFVGRLEEDERTIRGVCTVSLPERVFFAFWYALLAGVTIVGFSTFSSLHSPSGDVTRFVAVLAAMVILGFFATRLSWLGRSAHVAWLAALVRRAAST